MSCQCLMSTWQYKSPPSEITQSTTYCPTCRRDYIAPYWQFPGKIDSSTINDPSTNAALHIFFHTMRKWRRDPAAGYKTGIYHAHISETGSVIELEIRSVRKLTTRVYSTVGVREKQLTASPHTPPPPTHTHTHTHIPLASSGAAPYMFEIMSLTLKDGNYA